MNKSEVKPIQDHEILNYLSALRLHEARELALRKASSALNDQVKALRETCFKDFGGSTRKILVGHKGKPHLITVDRSDRVYPKIEEVEIVDYMLSPENVDQP